MITPALVKRLRGDALRMAGGHHANADDALQDTLMSALEHADFFEPGRDPMAWLFTVLRNRVRDQYSRAPRRLEVNMGDSDYCQDATPDLAVREAVAALPAERREVVDLYVEGYTTTEISKRLGIKRGTVMTRMHRARKQLGEVLL